MAISCFVTEMGLRMIRLIASDMDDTLLNRDGQISSQNKEVIKEAVAQGIIFTLVTGRMFQSAVPYAFELGLDQELPIICYNGALIKRVSGETLYEDYLSPELALAVAEYGQRQGWTMNAYFDDELYVAAVNSYVEHYVRVARVRVYPVGDLVKFISDGNKRLAKILIPGRAEDSQARIAQLKDLLGTQAEITCSKPEYVEITSAGTNKGRALRWLADFLHIQPAEILAIGDGNNDISMLQMAGTSVAVGNAAPQAKEAAKYITSPSWEHGVAKAITQFAFASRNLQ